MIDSILGIVSKFIPDKNKQMELASKMETEFTKQMKLKSDIIKAEVEQGGITSKWRPITMCCFVAMVVIHWMLYDIVPFIRTTFNLDFYVPQDPGFTDGLLSLIQLGLGGYIGGRTVEKVARIWKK